MKIPKCILVPVDYSDASLAALDFGILIAEQFKSRLALLTVGRGDYLSEAVMVFSLSLADDSRRLRQTLRDRMNAGQAELDREKIEVLVKTGDAVEQILKAAKETEADMIVMGTHGRRGAARTVLGSVTEETIRRSPCPVLAIRAGMPVPQNDAGHSLAGVEAKMRWLGGE